MTLVSSRRNESSMLAEIREQGDLLGRVLPRLQAEIDEKLASAAGKNLHLVGCGDMYFAASQVEALARVLWELPVRAWRSMDLRWLHHQLTSGDLVVCASVSGRTPRTLEAALLARRAGARVLGITDNPGSPLDEALEETLILDTAALERLADKSYAGYRHIIAQTQTFTAVWAVELMLASALTGARADLAWIPERVGKLVTVLDRPARELAEVFFVGCEQVMVLGSGPHWPAACYGAAKMLEFAVPATARCLEEFNHLEAFVTDPATRIIVLAADDEARSRARELTGDWECLGTRSLVLGRGGEFPGERTQLLELPSGDLLDSIISQVIALQLLVAWGVSAMGRDPDRWLGGRRTEQVQAMSQRTIRGSRLWKPDH
jgi:glucosamine--fructose-6-phosphate aminotransferase (isomerizing)